MTTQRYHHPNTAHPHEEQWYKSLYESSLDLYSTTDKNGIITGCNKSFADSIGYSKKEIIGQSILDHVAEQSIKVIHDSFHSWKKLGYVKNKEIWLKRKDDTVFPVLLSANPVFDNDGKVIGSNIVMKDIYEIYQAREKIQEHELQIENTMEELKRVNESRDQFLAMITHELKTPLVPIKGYTDLLLNGKFGSISEQQRPKLEMIKSCSEIMLKLISDLLDVQKLELGKLRLNKEIHNMAEVIATAVERTKSDADRYGVTINVDLQSDLSYLCDKIRIQQVIINLLLNSIDFCPKQTGKIDVKLFSENNEVKIVIVDNGKGIEKEKLDKLFSKFYQADTSATREHGGSGLGLSICKGIIENHGGKIWAESDSIGKGIKIHILLPKDNVTMPFFH